MAPGMALPGGRKEPFMIKVEIIADSIGPDRSRITTMVWTYPRFIHAEVMTHRVFARNAASSRAIPIQKMLTHAKATPACPSEWGRNGKGMQAIGALDHVASEQAQVEWLAARDEIVRRVEEMEALGVHKQITNRMLEPWLHITTLVTATEWANFFNLRAHPDAQPEFQRLAFLALKRYLGSSPSVKREGEWHMPYADRYMESGLAEAELLKIVTARAARVSYLTMAGDIVHAKDYELHDRLASDGHWSPFEHAARATGDQEYHGCYRGWLPYRKLFTDENHRAFDGENLLARCPFPEWLEAQ